MTRRGFLQSAAFGAFALPRLLAARPRTKLEEIVAKARTAGWKELPIGERVGEVGKCFLETPYVGQTLELADDTEACVVNLSGLDCVTFFETSLGIARMLAIGKSDIDNLRREVTFTRYRGGKLDGYLSRLHYTSEWIADNARKKTVRDLTPELPGAKPFEKEIDFMSTHPKQYRQLAAHPEWVPEIAKIERRLTAVGMHYVPRDRVAEAEPLLQTGDIVGIATSIEGIDCSHTGLCLREPSGVLRFMHASSTAGKVVVGPRLSEYIAGSARNLGMMIARPIEGFSSASATEPLRL